jgi:hypothetical protein
MSPENQNSPYESKIPFEPEEFGFDMVNLDDVEEAIIYMAEGDMKLFLSEWALSTVERHYNEGKLSVDEFRSSQSTLGDDIAVRRQQLGLPERPGWHTS